MSYSFGFEVTNVKIIFLGDSITQGVGVDRREDSFAETVGRELHCQILNAGMGSTRIVRSDTGWEEPHWHTLDFNARAEVLPPDCDYCFVFGGTNDYGDGDAPVGSEDDLCFYTFAGAVNILTDKLINKYGPDKLVFITPCRRYSEEAHISTHGNKAVAPFSEFVEMLIGILDRKNIRYIDLYNDPGMPKPSGVSNEGCFRDGLHPNEKGHRHIADRIIEFIKSDHKF